MTTSQSQLDFLIETIGKHQEVTAKKMFGEYGLYQSKKFFGMVCDNRLFLKATEDLKQLLTDDSIRPYEGAGQGYYHVPEELIEDEKQLLPLLNASLNFVPKPKTKKVRQSQHLSE